MNAQQNIPVQPKAPVPGPGDRFADVVRLGDYLDDGLRPHYWEEAYVKRVMEAVHSSEMKLSEAALILGVNYGTLYARYRRLYGCVSRRPHRKARIFWQAKSPSEVVERLQSGELSLAEGASLLEVSVSNLAVHLADLIPAKNSRKELESTPCEMNPSLPVKSYTKIARHKSNATMPPEI